MKEKATFISFHLSDMYLAHEAENSNSKSTRWRIVVLKQLQLHEGFTHMCVRTCVCMCMHIWACMCTCLCMHVCMTYSSSFKFQWFHLLLLLDRYLETWLVFILCTVQSSEHEQFLIHITTLYTDIFDDDLGQHLIVIKLMSL